MQHTLTLPYLRTTSLHIPRRDLVVASSDSLSLRITVVEADDPDAQMLSITGGIGGPAAQLTIWQDYDPSCSCCDYGRPPIHYSVLWTGMGTPQIGIGAFDWRLPIGTLANMPRRCGWAVQMGWDDNAKADTLMWGRIHIRGRFGPPAPLSQPLLTDDSVPVLEDDTDPVFA